MISRYEKRDTALSAVCIHGSSSYPARFHKDLEMVYVISGYMEVSIDAKRWRLEAGDMYVAFPNVIHEVHAQSCEKYLVIVSPALIPGTPQLLLHSKPRCPVLRGEPEGALVRALFDRCARLQEQDPQANRGTVAAHVGSILSEMLRRLELEPWGSDTGLVQRIVEYVLEGYTEDISLEGMARSLGCSKYHLSRVIGNTFGCNFRALVNNYRVGMAEDLLQTTQRSVSRIAYDCGFQNQSSFNRVFRAQCGMTPREYRAAAGPEKHAGAVKKG